ncbi:hypothetical protein ABIE61_002976 [Marinobacterium sp. MBR-111]|jgi:hypothetical protein|uniref:hypothetical protein n=1 Tax=Marinobacterium sp. MBR-111 TaxID=3156463 RepID=UPI0033923CDC
MAELSIGDDPVTGGRTSVLSPSTHTAKEAPSQQSGKDEMGTRYGRRASDGTYEYYDNKDILLEAKERDERKARSEARAEAYGIFGFFACGVLAYLGFWYFDGADLPKWLRFSSIVASCCLGAFIFAKLADFLSMLISIVFLVAILGAIGFFVWSVV